jgi:hypothetical protein
MKPLTELKNDLTKGRALILIWAKEENHRYLNIKRYIVGKQSNGVTLNIDKDASGGSLLSFPRASLVDYCEDGTITIYNNGVRDLTMEEKAIISVKPSNRPENAERVKNDLLTDGSQMYWADKRYFQDRNMAHLSGGSTRVKGMFLNCDGKIDDINKRGEAVLKYKISN